MCFVVGLAGLVDWLSNLRYNGSCGIGIIRDFGQFWVFLGFVICVFFGVYVTKVVSY